MTLGQSQQQDTCIPSCGLGGGSGGGSGSDSNGGCGYGTLPPDCDNLSHKNRSSLVSKSS